LNHFLNESKLDLCRLSLILKMASALTSDIPGADPAWHRRHDHPNFKDSHYKLQRFVREYVDREIAPNVEEWERNAEVPETVSRSYQQRRSLMLTNYRPLRDMRPWAFWQLRHSPSRRNI
jgi:hypothetical protein